MIGLDLLFTSWPNLQYKILSCNKLINFKRSNGEKLVCIVTTASKIEILCIINLHSVLGILILKGYINVPLVSLVFSSGEIETGSSKFLYLITNIYYSKIKGNEQKCDKNSWTSNLTIICFPRPILTLYLDSSSITD